MKITSTVHKVKKAFLSELATVTPMFTGGIVWSETNTGFSVVCLDSDTTTGIDVIVTYIQRENTPPDTSIECGHRMITEMIQQLKAE